MVQSYLVIGLGGAMGSMLRFAMATMIDNRFGGTFPIGTFMVNMTGCLVIGIIESMFQAQGNSWLTPLVRQFLMIGILGGYTTFSAFGLQTFNLVVDREWFYAALYTGLSFTLSLIAVWAGWAMGRGVLAWK